MRRLPFLSLALAALMACGKAPATDPPAVLDTLQAGFLDDSDGCMFARVPRFVDPQALVMEYVTRDAAGGFLATSPWIDSALTCPGHLPGWDANTVITGFEVGTATVAGPHATVPVSYTAVGGLDGWNHFSSVPRSVQVVFELVNTPWGWRIDGPQLAPMVLADSLLALGTLPDSVELAIRAALRQ